MNSLSWIIFWADVAPQISTALCVASFLTFITLGFMTLMGATDMFGEASFDVDGLPRNTQANIALRFRRLWVLLPFLATIWSLTWLVPDDKETYYAIAASEVGEEILKTPEVGKARQALSNWLDKQIEENSPTPMETENAD